MRNSDVTEELTREEMKSMMNAISNVLEEMNAGSWEELRREEPNRAVDVMFVVDAYVAVFARQQPVNTSTSLSMPMLLVELDVQPVSDVRGVTYPRDGTWPEGDVLDDTCDVPMQTLENVAATTAGARYCHTEGL